MTIKEIIGTLEAWVVVEEANAKTYAEFKTDDRFLDKCVRCSCRARAYREAAVILKEAYYLEED